MGKREIEDAEEKAAETEVIADQIAKGLQGPSSATERELARIVQNLAQSVRVLADELRKAV